MAGAFKTTYTRPSGPFKVKLRELAREASELMIEDAIKNIIDVKKPSRRSQKRNTRETLDRKARKGYGNKALIERRKSLTRRSGWAMGVKINSRSFVVSLRPNRRFLSDAAIRGLLAKGYDFIGVSKSALRRIASFTAKRTRKMLESRKVKTTTFK